MSSSKRQRLLEAATGGGSNCGEQQQAECSFPGPGGAAAAAAALAGARADDEEELLAACLPSDLEAAVQFLRDESRARLPALPPLVLVSQLKALLKDTTAMERGLDEMLHKKNSVRLFKLASGADDHGLLYVSDYTELINAAASPPAPTQQPSHSTEQPQEQQQHQRAAAARSFCAHVLASHSQPSISHARLLSLLARGAQEPGPALDAEQQVSALLQLGVLSRHPGDDRAYLLCVPGLGPVVKGVMAGRKELLRIVARKQNPVQELQLVGSPVAAAAAAAAPGGRGKRAAAAAGGVHLRSSPLGTAYHLRDLLGKGELERVHTPAGVYIRVARRTS